MNGIDEEDGENDENEDDWGRRVFYFAVLGALGMKRGASWRQSFCITMTEVNKSMAVQVR